MTSTSTPIQPLEQPKVGRLEQACIDYRADHVYFVYRPTCGCAACQRREAERSYR